MSATFSACGRYRYRLGRDFDKKVSTRGVAFLMLNPSTASATTDDPTIRRCIGFAQSWGYGWLVVGNVYALRSTDPRVLWNVDDPVGPENDRHLGEICREAELVVCAWGAHAKPDRVAQVRAVIESAGQVPHALRLTAAGAPGHPLYLPGDLKPFAWQP